MITKRERHRRNILHAPLKRNPHRPTIMYIDRSIVTMVDTAYHHIRLPWYYLSQSHLHTIDGRTIARPYFKTLMLLTQANPQWFCGRERTRIAAPSRLRGTDNDISHVGQHLHKHTNTLRIIPIIIGNQQKRSFIFHKISTFWLQKYEKRFK